MRKYSQLSYLLILTLVCGGVALAAHQWTLQPQESKLTFVGIQADAEFEGFLLELLAEFRGLGIGHAVTVTLGVFHPAMVRRRSPPGTLSHSAFMVWASPGKRLKWLSLKYT